jgi:hypothetical protein
MVVPVTLVWMLTVHPPGFTTTGKMWNWDGVPLTHVAAMTCGPHDIGPSILRLVTVTEVAEFAVKVIGIASLDSSHRPAPPVNLALVIVAVPSALTDPAILAVQPMVAGPGGGDMLIEPIATKVLPEKEEAEAGLASVPKMQAAAQNIPKFLMTVLSCLYSFAMRRAVTRPKPDAPHGRSGG